MSRRYHLHLPGLVYIAVALLTGLAATNSQNNLLFWMFGVMVAALLISGFISGAMMMGLEIHRLDPRHGTVGEPLIVRYAVRNRNRLVPVFNIHIVELSARGRAPWQRLMAPARAWIMHIGPGESVHGDAILWPLRRGEAQFAQVRVWTTFPFNLVKKSVTLSQPQHTLVYPRLYELNQRVLRAVVPEGAMGTRISRRSGAGDDYYGLREYRPGDSLRHIAWKHTARRDMLLCIERTRPSPPKIRVVLNLTRAAAGESVEPAEIEAHEERAISLAASLLHGADRAGFEIGLTVLGADVPPIPVRRNAWHLGKIMAALASIDSNAPRGSDLPLSMPPERHEGVVVIHPDRIRPFVDCGRALDLSARRLDDLTAGPIGWAGPADRDAPMRPVRGGNAA